MKKLRKIVFNKWFLSTLLLGNILINAFFASVNNILNSDFVYNILFFDQLFKSRVYLPPDSSFLHYPIAYVFLKTFGYTLLGNFSTTLFLVLCTLGTYCFFYIYFLKKYLSDRDIIYFLPFFYLLTYPGSFTAISLIQRGGALSSELSS